MGPERSCDLRRLVANLAVGEAQDAVAQALKARVTFAIGLEGGAVAVVPEAVGLRDQLVVAPKEIDLVCADAGIHLWLGKAVATAEVEEEPLELAACELILALEVSRVDEAQIQRTADRPSKDRLGNGAMEVTERPRRLGDRDAVAAGRNSGNEGVGSVDRYAVAPLMATVSGHRDMDRAVARCQETPQGRGAAVANNGIVCECEYCRHAPALEAESRMPDGVNPAMKTMEPGPYWRLCQPLVD